MLHVLTLVTLIQKDHPDVDYPKMSLRTMLGYYKMGH